MHICGNVTECSCAPAQDCAGASAGLIKVTKDCGEPGKASVQSAQARPAVGTSPEDGSPKGHHLHSKGNTDQSPRELSDTKLPK